MQPIRTQILFQPMPSDEVSEGGIFVPETARAISNKGVIKAVGRGTAKKPMMFTPGDTVYRVKDWGCEIIIDGELHFLMDMDAILAKE